MFDITAVLEKVSVAAVLEFADMAATLEFVDTAAVQALVDMATAIVHSPLAINKAITNHMAAVNPLLLAAAHKFLAALSMVAATHKQLEAFIIPLKVLILTQTVKSMHQWLLRLFFYKLSS